MISFYITIKNWKSKLKYIELQPDAKPYHVKPYLVLGAHTFVFKKEGETIFQLRVLKKLNR